MSLSLILALAALFFFAMSQLLFAIAPKRAMWFGWAAASVACVGLAIISSKVTIL